MDELLPVGSNTALYAALGFFVAKEVGTAIVQAVKWWTGRAVKREDDLELKRDATLADHGVRLTFIETEMKLNAQRLEVDLSTSVTELEKRLSDQIAVLDRTMMQAQSDVRNIGQTTDNIRTVIVEIKNNLEQRLEKQGEFYRASVKETLTHVEKQLEDLEFKMRTDATRAISDSLPRTKRRRG